MENTEREIAELERMYRGDGTPCASCRYPKKNHSVLCAVCTALCASCDTMYWRSIAANEEAAERKLRSKGDYESQD